MLDNARSKAGAWLQGLPRVVIGSHVAFDVRSRDPARGHSKESNVISIWQTLRVTNNTCTIQTKDR